VAIRGERGGREILPAASSHLGMGGGMGRDQREEDRGLRAVRLPEEALRGAWLSRELVDSNCLDQDAYQERADRVTQVFGRRGEGELPLLGRVEG
jgi:hypothetical protein